MADTELLVKTKARQRAWFLLLALPLLTACSSPTQHFDDLAHRFGMTKRLLVGQRFQHIVYAHPQPSSQTLHIYLDGDGSPWLHGRYIANDPTPQNPLALELAALDNQVDSVYLGRPCYLGLSKAPLCDASLWTSARYSDAVVRSMAAAADTIIVERGSTAVTLIGYSGGGSLAMLMLEYMASVDAVVTIAANLDTDSWTEYHKYLPLAESRNPMLASYSNSVQYRHFVGEDDNNVPAQQTRAFVAKHGGILLLIPGFSHRCCWREQWPSLLEKHSIEH